MDLLKDYGINIPKGGVAKTPQEAFEIAEKLGKSQGSSVVSQSSCALTWRSLAILLIWRLRLTWRCTDCDPIEIHLGLLASP